MPEGNRCVSRSESRTRHTCRARSWLRRTSAISRGAMARRFMMEASNSSLWSLLRPSPEPAHKAHEDATDHFATVLRKTSWSCSIMAYWPYRPVPPFCANLTLRSARPPEQPMTRASFGNSAVHQQSARATDKWRSTYWHTSVPAYRYIAIVACTSQYMRI